MRGVDSRRDRVALPFVPLGAARSPVGGERGDGEGPHDVRGDALGVRVERVERRDGLLGARVPTPAGERRRRRENPRERRKRRVVGGQRGGAHAEGLGGPRVTPGPGARENGGGGACQSGVGRLSRLARAVQGGGDGDESRAADDLRRL